MAKIWRNRIIAGDKTYLDVPLAWKSAVKDLLREDVASNVITAEQYEEIIGEVY